MGLLVREWPIVGALLVGLLALKITVISAIGPTFGLSRAESLRTGFVLSQVRRGGAGGQGRAALLSFFLSFCLSFFG